MPAPLDALFVRWRSTGQPEPLGELFDRASPQLLAVALHLCSHPADAEDALQATFVAAIDAAASWDAARPVLPWLLGILTKQCRRIGERRARRREQELPAEPLVLEDGSPLAASERRELVGKLREHIDRLPAEQRQVLLLQLEHGLTPAEVAEVLGVPPGTVRMRLHRGVQALRGVLPAGLVALLMSALPSRGVAAVRAAVVGYGVAAAAVGGGMLVAKKIALVAAVVLVLAGAWTFAVSWGAGGDEMPAPIAPVRAMVAALPSGADAGDAHDAAAPRVEAERAPVVMAADAAGEATGSLLVRAVRADTKLPIAGLPLRVYRAGSDVGDRFDGESACTGADGTALVRDLAPGVVHVFTAGATGKGDANVVASAIATLEVLVVGAAIAPCTVRGRVRRADGTAAPGAVIVVGPRYEGYAAPIGVADAAGCFAYELPGLVAVIGARLAGEQPSPLQFPPADGDAIELVLPGPGARAAVRVVAPTGEPVAGARIEIGPRRRGTWEEEGRTLSASPPQHGRTNADGCLLVADLPAGDVEVLVRADGCAPFHRFAQLHGGARTDVLCTLDAGASVRGRVVDQFGAPVADVYTRLGGAVVESRTSEADGRFVYRHASSGRQQLQLSAQHILTRCVEREAEDREWVIAVERATHYSLRFVDDMARPLAEWSVRLQSAVEREVATDANGCAVLPAFGAGPYTLWLGAPDSLQAVVPCPWPDAVPGVERTVVVPIAQQPSGSLRGTLVTADGAPFAGGWFTVCDAEGHFLAQTAFTGTRFEVRKVPMGDWVLSVHREQTGCPLAQFRVAALQHGEARDLGELRLPAEGALLVHVVRADGGDAKDTTVFVFDGHGHESQALADGAPHAFPAGRYTWTAMHEETLWPRGSFEVRAGATTSLEILLQPGVRRPLRFPVPAPDWGTPRRVDYVLRAPDGSVYDEGDFDPREELPYHYVPTLACGTWRLELRLDDGRRYAGSFRFDSMVRSLTSIDVAVEPSR